MLVIRLSALQHLNPAFCLIACSGMGSSPDCLETAIAFSPGRVGKGWFMTDIVASLSPETDLSRAVLREFRIAGTAWVAV